VSIVDFTGWKDQEGVSSVIRYLREGYRVVRHTNAQLADEAGVPRSIRLTTVKPGGTVPKMAGRTAGASHPTFKYTLMRVQVEKNHPVVKLLQDAGVPYEQSVYDKNNYVFEWPVEQGPAEPAGEVSIWEQAFNIVLLQREWADNAVSNTLYFRPQKQLVGIINVDEVSMYDQGELVREGDKYKVYRSDPGHEEGQLEAVLAHIAPYVKSVSLLPHSDKGIFPQMPQEGITKESYDARLESIRKIDWSQFEGSDGQDEKFCTGEACEV